MTPPTLTPTLVRFALPGCGGRPAVGTVVAWEATPRATRLTVTFTNPGAPRFPVGGSVPLILEDEASGRTFETVGRVFVRCESDLGRRYEILLGAPAAAAELFAHGVCEHDHGHRPSGSGMDVLVASLRADHAVASHVQEISDKGLTLDVSLADEGLLSQTGELEVVLRLSPQEPLGLRARIAGRRLVDERIRLELTFLAAGRPFETKRRLLVQHLALPEDGDAAA